MPGQIELRGVAVHNLQDIDLDIPHRQLVVICGVSGSGKTSLALDTLYAEGQRRYIESFSAYTRQFLARLEKPASRRIDGIPPSIAVTRTWQSPNSRATVATATEIYDHLQLLFARLGQVVCHGCGQPVTEDTPESAAARLGELSDGARYMLAFIHPRWADWPLADVFAALKEDGFVRAVVGARTVHLDDAGAAETASAAGRPVYAIVDRLSAGSTDAARIRESIEIAWQQGEGSCTALVAYDGPPRPSKKNPASQFDGLGGPSYNTVEIDGRQWQSFTFSQHLRCETCGIDYPLLEPRLFSFNSPLGACETCEGFGNIVEPDIDLIVPDKSKSLADGAIACWTTKAYSHELEELLALAPDHNLPTDVPWDELTDAQRRLVWQGVPDRDFGGLQGFFAWLEKRKYKTHIRAFLSRWRSYRPCSTCCGGRLKPEALAVQVGGKNIGEVTSLEVRQATDWFANVQLDQHQQQVARLMLEQIESRLAYLNAVGLGYLTLDRKLRTLSGGEAQRVSLTSALGSVLVNMLYVLDEPSVGLHPRDVEKLVNVLRGLRDRGNSVIVVEHEPDILAAADQLIEIGPAAGAGGGQVVYQGDPAKIVEDEASLTGAFLAGKRGVSIPQRKLPNRGRITLRGARGHNLKNITVEFPLNLLCLVTGVSGSGKTTLVHETLYPALAHRKHQDAEPPLPVDDILGTGQIDEVVLVDQSPIGRSPRSNPVTYIKAFDAIRNTFAETVDARTHNYTASHFSFNVDGGRCETCGGDGYQQIDMQFMADVLVRCPACRGTRYRKEILEVTYRKRNIADVLAMTVREAFGFFRGQVKVQNKLKSLIDVGLEYLTLGQPASTLSAGEAQRLKLASYLGSTKKGRTLFVLDEPTTGLHFADVVRLLDCFESLLAVGHSLIVVEYNLQLMKSADWLIDLGPGAAGDGGEVVCQGPPEEIAACAGSHTGRYLRAALSLDT